MTQAVLEGLERRLDRLERENRLLRRFGGGLAVAVGLLVLSQALGIRTAGTADAQQPFTVVAAQQFVLQDGSGHIRAVLGLERQTDAAQLRLFGPVARDGVPTSVSMDASHDSAGFGLSGPGPGSSAVDLYAGSDRAGLINVHDAAGNIVWRAP